MVNGLDEFYLKLNRTMKKYLLIALLLTFLLPIGRAQTDAKAKAILVEVSRKYKSYDIVKTDFVFTLDNPQAKMKDTQNGTLYVKSKSNKYKVVTPEQDLISDGKTQWTYLKHDKEVQISEVDNSSDAINPAKLFTIYEQGFKYIYSGDVKVNGKIEHVIDLSPLDTKRSYFKIRLNIDKASKHITKAVIFDKNGNKYTYAIKAFTPNVKISESVFAFDAKKFPGVNVEDLR